MSLHKQACVTLPGSELRWDDVCSRQTNARKWPRILDQTGGVIAQVVGSAPLLLDATWSIRRYGAGSDVNVLLRCGFTAEKSPAVGWGSDAQKVLAKLASVFLMESSIATAEVGDGPVLRIRMFAGLHIEVRVCQGVGTFVQRIGVRDWIAESLARTPGLRSVIIVLKNFFKSVDLDAEAGDGGLPSSCLYRLAILFSEELASRYVPVGSQGFLLVGFIKFLIHIPTRCGRTVDPSVGPSSALTSLELDQRLTSIVQGIQLELIVPALESLLSKDPPSFEPLTACILCMVSKSA